MAKNAPCDDAAIVGLARALKKSILMLTDIESKQSNGSKDRGK
jgi:hypothetical protein